MHCVFALKNNENPQICVSTCVTLRETCWISNLKKLERQKISTVSQLTLFLSEHHDDVLRISAKIQRRSQGLFKHLASFPSRGRMERWRRMQTVKSGFWNSRRWLVQNPVFPLISLVQGTALAWFICLSKQLAWASSRTVVSNGYNSPKNKLTWCGFTNFQESVSWCTWFPFPVITFPSHWKSVKLLQE